MHPWGITAFGKEICSTDFKVATKELSKTVATPKPYQ